MEKNSLPTNYFSDADTSVIFQLLPTELLKIIKKSLDMRDLVNLQRTCGFFSSDAWNKDLKNEILEKDIRYISPYIASLDLLIVDGYVVKAKDQDFFTLQNKRIKQVFYTQTEQKGMVLFLMDNNQFFYNQINNEASGIGNSQFQSIWAGLNNHSNYFKCIDGIPAYEQIKEVQISGLNMLVLTEAGNVYAWGENDRGQLGANVSEKGKNNFTKVECANEQQKVKQIFLRDGAAWVITEDNKILACGSNLYGKLGIVYKPQLRIIKSFTPINSFSNDNLTVENILVYGDTAWIITTDYQVFATGHYVFGQLGSHPKCNNPIFIDSFNLIQPLGNNETVKNIVFTELCTLILTESGHVFAAGRLPGGVYNAGEDKNFILVPGIPDNEKVSEIIPAINSNSVWVITDQGKVYACGQNYKAQLGTGDLVDKNIFTPVKGIADDEKVKYLIPETDKYNTWIITENNRIFTCGDIQDPQFIQVKGIPLQLEIKEIIPSNDHRVFILTKDGQVFTSHADVNNKQNKHPEFVNVTPNGSKIEKIIISPFKFDTYDIHFLSADKKLYTLKGELVHDLNKLVFAGENLSFKP